MTLEWGRCLRHRVYAGVRTGDDSLVDMEHVWKPLGVLACRGLNGPRKATKKKR
jgi:hypothetical protein